MWCSLSDIMDAAIKCFRSIHIYSAINSMCGCANVILMASRLATLIYLDIGENLHYMHPVYVHYVIAIRLAAVYVMMCIHYITQKRVIRTAMLFPPQVWYFCHSYLDCDNRQHLHWDPVELIKTPPGSCLGQTLVDVATRLQVCMCTYVYSGCSEIKGTCLQEDYSLYKSSLVNSLREQCTQLS